MPGIASSKKVTSKKIYSLIVNKITVTTADLPNYQYFD